MSDTPKEVRTLSPDERRKLLREMLQERSAPTADEGESRPEGFWFPPEFLDLQENFKDRYGLEPGEIYFLPSEGLNSNLTRINGRELINYAGYNYVGMSGDPVVSQAAKDAIDRYGTSVSASRLGSGERPLHAELESTLCEFLGTEACTTFVGGYITNEGVIGHLLGNRDLILYDSYIHASVQEGCKLSGATIRPFPHNNWEALDKILRDHRQKYHQVLVVIEGVYSMDGDIPDLPRFIEVKKRHSALLMVDEAHSIGVIGETGRGLGEYHAVDRADVDLWMGTLSKSFASCGGYIAGGQQLVDYVRYTAPAFVFSVGMSPPNAAAALAAVQLLKRTPERIARVQERAKLFLNLAKEYGLDTGTSRDSGIVPVFVGHPVPCVRLYKALYDRGILALPIMYPSVPVNTARLRFFLSSEHTEEQIRTTVEAVADCFPRS